MSPTIRRSLRRPKENLKYVSNDWDNDISRRLEESDASSEPSNSGNEGPTNDKDFENIPRKLSENEDDISSTDSHKSTSDVLIEKISTDELDVGDHIEIISHSRGLKQVSRKGAKDVLYPQLFGPNTEDLTPILLSRDIWMKGRDITFPSRATLANNIVKILSYAKSELDLSNTNAHQNRQISKSIQILQPISEREVRTKYLIDKPVKQSIVVGPWGQQQIYDLPYCKTFQIEKGWEINENVRISIKPEHYHQGWLINLGEKIQSLAWAPNEGTIQYLAITSRCDMRQTCTIPPASQDDAPAFHSSLPHLSNIQIWAFDGEEIEGMKLRTLSQQSQPRLKYILGTDYGNIRQLMWSPKVVSNDSTVATLATVASDGIVRFIDLLLNQNDHIMNSYKIITPALTIFPPSDIIFTTLAFISKTDVIVGASDGSIRLYNILSGKPTPKPYLTYQLHNTYVLSLCSTFPSPIPTIIASSSASGEIQLIDLRNPDHDKVNIRRARIPTKNLIYSPLTRSFITTVDTSGQTEIKNSSQSTVICHQLRHFYTTTFIAKLPELSGNATSLAGSSIHPCILVGNAKGTVFASNYLRKVLPIPRIKSNPGPAGWLQKLCEYEWRPDSTEKNSDINLYHGNNRRPGTSRFQEGFKPVKIQSPSYVPKKRSKVDETENTADMIFEEEQAVTSIVWNPNPNFAGWAAIGWGSGILRVQDLSHTFE